MRITHRRCSSPLIASTAPVWPRAQRAGPAPPSPTSFRSVASTPFLLLTVLASILAAGCAADRRRGEQTRAHECLRQRLHPAEPSDRAAAGHREENGALHPHQQSGVPVSRLHANRAHQRLQSEVLDAPLLLRPLLLRAPPRAGAHPIRGQRRPATLRRLPAPAVPQHTESLPTIPHRLTQRHQCQSECVCV